MKKDRDYFLAEAQKLIKGPRAKDYGPVKKNHQRIADIWTILLDNKYFTLLFIAVGVYSIFIVSVSRTKTLYSITF